MTAGQPRHRTPAPPAPAPGGWRYRAACRFADLDLFFPGRGESAEPARRVCAGCTVREPYLDYALRNGITHGIWGGLAERDRRALRSRRAGAARRARDEAITAAFGAGSSQAVIGRAFGLARTSVSGSCPAKQTGRGGHEPPPGLHLASVVAAGPRQARHRELAHAGRSQHPADPGPARMGQLAGPGADQAQEDVVTEPVFPEDSWVQVRYPRTREQEHGDRAGWPWLPGWVVARCGPDEWEICVQAPDLATWHQGEAWYPVCFRDSSEIRLPEAQADLERPAGPELEAQ